VTNLNVNEYIYIFILNATSLSACGVSVSDPQNRACRMELLILVYNIKYIIDILSLTLCGTSTSPRGGGLWLWATTALYEYQYNLCLHKNISSSFFPNDGYSETDRTSAAQDYHLTSILFSPPPHSHDVYNCRAQAAPLWRRCPCTQARILE